MCGVPCFGSAVDSAAAAAVVVVVAVVVAVAVAVAVERNFVALVGRAALLASGVRKVVAVAQ